MHFKFELWRWCMWPLVTYADVKDVKDVSSVNAVAVIIAMANIIGPVDEYLDEKRASFIGTWFVFIITEFYIYSIFGFR